MARITFLGSGGGRFTVLTQLRASGGFILEMDGEMLHIDPGPGALVRARQYRVRLRKLTGILCSHCHPDHYTDLEMAVESMTAGAKKKRGTLLMGENVLKGSGEFRPAISRYHLRVLEGYKTLRPGEKAKTGALEIRATPTRHGDPKGIGFVIKGSETIGYTSDTEYFPGLEKHFEGCDTLIMNVLRPRNVEWPEHMSTNQAERFLKALKGKPGLAVIQGFGMKMLRANPFREAAWLEKRTGIKIIAAKDGQVIETKGEGKARGLEKFIK
jgi:phosphoribosyl 1,2-cyclic phosphodiesterase